MLWKIRDSLNHIGFVCCRLCATIQINFSPPNKQWHEWEYEGRLANLIGIRVTVFDVRVFMSLTAFFFLFIRLSLLVCDGYRMNKNIHIACCAVNDANAYFPASEHRISFSKYYIFRCVGEHFEMTQFISVASGSVSRALRQHTVPPTRNQTTSCAKDAGFYSGTDALCYSYLRHFFHPFSFRFVHIFLHTDCANVTQHKRENKISE